MKQYIDKLQGQLTTLGVNAENKIAEVREQLLLARSAAYLSAGLPGAGTSAGICIREKETGDALYESNEVMNGEPQHEVVRKTSDGAVGPQCDGSPASQWLFNPPTVGEFGYSVSNQLSSPNQVHYLHASVIPTSGGHKYLYTTTNWDYSAPTQECTVFPQSRAKDRWVQALTGYFQMRSRQYDTCVTFGTEDTTPGGKKRVYQDACVKADLSWADGTALYSY